jgi:methyl-accepting chemotaxis protein
MPFEPPADQPSRGQLEERVVKLVEEMERLKNVAIAFERWHQDMNSLMSYNRDMQTKSESLDTMARQLIMLSLNAAIEAARAGETAQGFVVVAAEVRSLANQARTLSADLSKDINRNDLTTTATFQDIQAGGKLMLAAISGVESMVKSIRTAVEETIAQ